MEGWIPGHLCDREIQPRPLARSMSGLSQYRGIALWGGASCLILAAAWLAGRNIGQPGLYYDEMLFINAARGGQGAMFLKSKFMGLPVLLMDYIGALKAWIYYPLVSLAPVTPGLIRYPAILFGLCGAVLTGMAFQRLMGRGGLLVGACLLFDPALLMHSRLDWGPTALMFLLRGLLLWAVAGWIADRRLRWLWLATVAAGLGIFDKLNFLWFACPTAIALCVCYHREIWLESRRRVLPHVVVGLAALAVGLLALGRAMAIQRGLGDTQSWSVEARMVQVVSLLKFTLAGGGVTDFVAGRGLRSAPLAIAALARSSSISIFGRLPFSAAAELQDWRVVGAELPSADGHIEKIKNMDGRFVRLDGWAVTLGKGQPTWGRVIDNGGQVIGIVMFGGLRPDVEKIYGPSARLSGFSGYMLESTDKYSVILMSWKPIAHLDSQ